MACLPLKRDSGVQVYFCVRSVRRAGRLPGEQRTGIKEKGRARRPPVDVLKDKVLSMSTGLDEIHNQPCEPYGLQGRVPTEESMEYNSGPGTHNLIIIDFSLLFFLFLYFLF